MNSNWQRRDILKLIGLGGVVFASGLAGCEPPAPARPAPRSPARPRPPARRACRCRISSSCSSPTRTGASRAAEPGGRSDAQTARHRDQRRRGAARLHRLTGDLTHTTDDAQARRDRMAQFKEIVAELKVKSSASCPASTTPRPIAARRSSRRSARRTTPSITKACTSSSSTTCPSPPARRRAARLARQGPRAAPAGRRRSWCSRTGPLFDLYPPWEWATKDGARALELLRSAPERDRLLRPHPPGEPPDDRRHRPPLRQSLIFPLPAPGAAPKRAPLPWDPASPDHGIGHRVVKLTAGTPKSEEVPYHRVTST